MASLGLGTAQRGHDLGAGEGGVAERSSGPWAGTRRRGIQAARSCLSSSARTFSLKLQSVEWLPLLRIKANIFFASQATGVESEEHAPNWAGSPGGSCMALPPWDPRLTLPNLSMATLPPHPSPEAAHRTAQASSSGTFHSTGPGSLGVALHPACPLTALSQEAGLRCVPQGIWVTQGSLRLPRENQEQQ